jgi:hypothetical protein
MEVWDADDFDPWDALRWQSVRVLFYRQYKSNGTLFEAFWLTDFPTHRLSSRSLFGLAKSRWEIENQGFNEAKNRYGLEPICHHHPQSLLLVWLITCLALTIASAGTSGTLQNPRPNQLLLPHVPKPLGSLEFA